MRHVEFPVESVLSNFDDPPGHGSEGLGRRAFLSASAALVAAPAMGLTTARAAARAVELPAAATQASGQEVVVGPQIPVITNLKDDLALDLDGIRVNVDYLVDHGMVTGKGVLLAAGAGGDFDILTLDERKQVARTIVETADGRVPVIVGVQDSNPDVSIELAKYSESIGAYGVQMSPPYYHVPSDDDTLRLYRRLHDATARVGIMVYNTWWHSYNIPFDVMDQLVDLERVVAIKWSHPGSPFNYAQGVKRYAGVTSHTSGSRSIRIVSAMFPPCIGVDPKAWSSGLRQTPTLTYGDLSLLGCSEAPPSQPDQVSGGANGARHALGSTPPAGRGPVLLSYLLVGPVLTLEPNQHFEMEAKVSSAAGTLLWRSHQLMPGRVPLPVLAVAGERPLEGLACALRKLVPSL